MLYQSPPSRRASNRIGHDLKAVLYLLIYRICLDAVYYGVLTGIYSYGGYRNNWNIRSYMVSWAIAIVYVALSKRLFTKAEQRLSDCIVIFLILVVVLPSTTVIGAGIFTTGFIVIDTVFWLFLIILHSYVSRKRIVSISLKIERNVFRDKIIYVFAFVSFALVLYINLRYTHFRISFDLSEAYELRSQAMEYNLPAILRYGFSWSRAVNNCMIAYCLCKKKYPTAVLFILAQILSFSIDGLKTTLFLPVIIIGINILYSQKQDARFFYYAISAASGICVLGVLEKRLLHTANITIIFIRRVFFTPVLLNYYYADFFSKNTPVYYRTLFGLRSPYSELGRMIGGIYANRPNMNCNNGMLGDAMINFGVAGVVVFPILFVFLLWIIDKCSESIDKLIIIPIAYYFASTLSNSVITTAFGTHGLLILTVLFLLMRSSSEESSGKSRRLSMI